MFLFKTTNVDNADSSNSQGGNVIYFAMVKCTYISTESSHIIKIH